MVQMKGSVVTARRGEDGKPIMFTDQPLISEDRWNLLQDSMRRRTKARGMPQSGHLLYRVLFCRNCSPELRDLDSGHAPKELPRKYDVQMYGHRRSIHTEKGSYYTCRKCGTSIRLERVESFIERLVLSEVGSRVLLERRIIPGDDHATEISRLERAAERRRELLADEPDDENMARSLAAMEARIAELRSKPHEPDRIEWQAVDSGITVADYWATLDTEGRGRFLRDWEVVCYADREGANVRLGWLELCGEAFRLNETRLAPTAMPALVAHSLEWQRVPGAVLPALVVQPPPVT
jgi:hypothetical protein